MIASRHGRGWQTIIADLALILFMVTAAAMQRGGEDEGEASEVLPLHGEPLAVYRSSQGAPPLRQWLEAQAPDERQRLTIVARHAPGGEEQAARAALALAAEAHAPARIVIEPAETPEVLAVLAFDADGNWHADCTGVPVQGARSALRKDNPCE